MQKTILQDHQAQVVVEVDPNRVQAARQRAARKMAARGKIPGFRPGKAPYDVILRHYGEEAVYEQAVDLLVDEVYPEILKEVDLKPAAAGLLEKVDGTDHPVFTFKIPLAPEVILGTYHKLRVPYEFKPPGPERLEKALEELRRLHATTETVERTSAPGDYVVVDIQSEAKDLVRTDFATIIRETEGEGEFPFPGFASRLTGLKAGETLRLHHDFSESVKENPPATQAVDVEVTVKAVRNMTLPDLDDSFAKTVGEYETLDALKEALSKQIDDRARAEYDDEYYTSLVDELLQEAVVKYAPQTLQHEAEHVVNDMRRRLAQQGLDMETYYKMRNTDATRFLEEEAKPIAKRRLERSLILDEIARLEKIEVDDSSLDQEFNNRLMDLQAQGLNLGAIRGGRQGQQRFAEALAMQSANNLLTELTLKRLRAIATGEYESSGAEAGNANAGDSESKREPSTTAEGKIAGAKAAPSRTKKDGTSRKPTPKSKPKNIKK